MQDVDTGIDQLYQGDLGGFVAARNALAKAARRPDLKALEKPSLPAWAVNQLFWHHRTAFDAVVHASEAVRHAHAQALAGMPADIRGAETAHRAAIRDAVRLATSVLTGAGHPATGATIEAITRTLEALPSSEARGRLVKPLAPAGLEALAGLTLQVPLPPAPSPPPSRPALRIVRGRSGASEDESAEAARERERARERAEAAARERQARREAAEAALTGAEAALAEAEQAVADAEAALADRQRAREAARAAVRQARRALDAI